MKQKRKTQMKVIRKSQPIPGLLRITAQCETRLPFGTEAEGGYIKVSLVDPTGKPVLRTYTLAEVDVQEQTLSIDIANHNGKGPGAQFAQTIAAGEIFSFYGPGPGKSVDPDCDDILLIGDLTAFPALKAQLRKIRDNRNVKTLCLVLDTSDTNNTSYFDFVASDPRLHISITSKDQGPQRWIPFIQTLVASPGSKKGLWCASERHGTLAVRNFLKTQPKEIFSRPYISSYWQEGLHEQQHAAAKRKDLSKTQDVLSRLLNPLFPARSKI